MATVVEREVHHTGDAALSAATIVLAVIAVAVIAGIALYVFGALPGLQPTTDNPGVNVNIDGDLPLPSSQPSPGPQY